MINRMGEYSTFFDEGSFITFSDSPDLNFYSVQQIHSEKIVKVVPEDGGPTAFASVKADGLVYFYNDWKQQSSLPLLAIRTADCLPLLILGKKGVALLHAGWKGVELEIFNNPIIELLLPHTFFIGPAIGVCCYQVGEEFTQKFTCWNRQEKGLYFDLAEEAQQKFLKKFSGVSTIFSHQCTCCEKNFHSYRRNQTTLRNFNLWIPKC